MEHHGVKIDEKALNIFCSRHGIQRLSLFGSIIHDDFKAASDIDVLVEFGKSGVPGLLRMVELETELSALIGRKADLRTPAELSRHFRAEVMREAETLYDQTK